MKNNPQIGKSKYDIMFLSISKMKLGKIKSVFKFIVIFFFVAVFAFSNVVSLLPQILQNNKLADSLKIKEAQAAVSIRNVGAYVNGTANLTPVIPATAAAGDMMLLAYGTKPYNDAPTIDQGWISIGSATDGTVAAGVDVGSMQTRIYYKIHTGSEVNPTITNGTNNVSGAVIIAFQKAANETWVTPVGAGGGDATAGTDFSVTASSNPGITAGDMLVGYAAIRSDAGTQSAINITATGLTLGAFTESPAADLATTAGGDMAMSGGYQSVTAGTASAAPVYASTLAAAHTGSAFIVRLRVQPAVTTISNFVSGEPGNSTIAPNASGMVDSFGLATDAGTDTVTAAIVGLAAGMGQYIQTVAITNDGDTVTYCSAAPSGDSASLSTCGIPVSTTNTQFKIKLTAKSHASMPAPAGGSYNVTATVTGFSSTNGQSGTDSGSSTLTIDNLSPGGTTGLTPTAGNAQVDLAWSNPVDGDFQQVYIYCKTSSMISGEAPAEGSDPAVDGTACDGTARMKYKGTTSPQTIIGLTNGQIYYFRIYARDTRGNFTAYSATQEATATPTAPASVITVSTSGTHTQYLDSGTTAQYLGGAFTFSINTGSDTINSVTVSQNGTASAANLPNVKLYYDNGGGYGGGDDTLFGTGALGSAIVGSMSITSGTTRSVYVVLDVGLSASGGQTIDPRVTAAGVSGGSTFSGLPADIGGTYPSVTIRPNITSYSNSTEPALTDGGRETQTISISGAGFGTTCSVAGGNKVSIGAYDLSCAGATFNNTTITIPVDAAIPDSNNGGTGASGLLITVGGIADDANQTFYVYPTIVSIDTNTGLIDKAREYSASDNHGLITVNGNHFGTPNGANPLTILGVNTSGYGTWGDSQITSVQVPTAIADNSYTGSIILTRNDNKNNTYTGFRILPRVISTGPVDAKGGQSQAITVNGDHFCQDGLCNDYATDSDNATFNGVSAKSSYTAVSDTSISLSVPATATDGNLIITSDSANGGTTYTSNNYSYNVKFGPSTPTGSSAGGSNNPTLSGTAFSDGTDGDTHYKANWQVAHNTDGDWLTPEWARTSGSAETSIIVNSTNGIFQNSDNGQTALDCGTTYKGRIRYMDNSNGGADTQTWEWSSWSSDYTFTTASCNVAPTLTITQPDGIGDAVNVGQSYNITYDLADPEQIVTVDFYYDSNSSGLDGTAIAGCQNQPEGTGVTCSWDTTGMSPGDYYVYGRDVNDGIAGEISDYSSGVITIQVSPEVIADSSGTQANLDAGVTGQYIGAAFRFRKTSGSAVNITAITLSETNASFAASLKLSNAMIRYEQNMAACAASPTITTGTLVKSGVSFTSEQANFSAPLTNDIPVTIGANYTCVYLFFDVGASAVGGDQIEIELSQAIDFTISDSTPKTGVYPVALSGTTNVLPNVTSIDYPVGGDGGVEGDTFAIYGAGFGTVAGSVTIQIGANSITTNSANNTVATGTIQTAFSDSNNGGTGVNGLLITVGGTADDTRQTFYVYPTIVSIDTNTGLTDKAREYSASDNHGLITINGNHFGTPNGANPLTILGINTSGYGTWGDSQITSVQVPIGIADNSYTGNIVLTRNDSKNNTYFGFRILPRITSTNPTNPVKGESVIIIGNHLCQSGTCPLDGSQSTTVDNVKFNDGAVQVSDVNVTAWGHGDSSTSGATMNVPLSAANGGIIIRSNDYNSNSFSVTISGAAPNTPTNLEQKTTSGITIALAAGASSTSIILEGDLSATSSKTMVLEVEFKAIGINFNETNMVTSTPTCVNSTSCVDQQVTLTGLSDGTQYHWRVRAKNVTTGDASDWVYFGGNTDPNDVDFYIDAQAPTISNVCAVNPSASSCDGTQPSDIQAQIRWETLNGENATRQVRYVIGSSCPAGADAAAVYNALTNVQPDPESAISVSPHSVTLNGLTAASTYQYKIKATDALGNTAYYPSDTTCNSFNTAAAQTRLMKTLEFYVGQSTATGNNLTASFDAFISESNVAGSNIYIKGAFMEVFGISKVDSANITVGIDFQSGLSPSGAVNYTINPGGTAPTYWNLTRQITNLDWDRPGDDTHSNTVSITVSGDNPITSLLGAKVYVTYYYEP